jgi:hypothetical protein
MSTLPSIIRLFQEAGPLKLTCMCDGCVGVYLASPLCSLPFASTDLFMADF